MEIQFLKNIYIKILVSLIVPYSLIACCRTSIHTEFENDSINTRLIHTPFVAANIVNKDSVCKIVVEESDIPIFTDEKRRQVLYPMLKNDTIKINDSAFNLLKKKCAFVVPQVRIDSLFNNANTNHLLDILFEYYVHKYGRHYILKHSYSEEELDYLIYKLFQHHIYLMTDCESGDLFIVNY